LIHPEIGVIFCRAEFGLCGGLRTTNIDLQNIDPFGLVTRRCLAATIRLALLVAGAPMLASATTHAVSHCDDTGAGGLRTIIADAATRSGETVDVASPLGCGKITLTSDEMAIAQSTLSIQGPNLDAFYVDGEENGRVFRHTGAEP
jgi:hypothetical protein